MDPKRCIQMGVAGLLDTQESRISTVNQEKSPTLSCIKIPDLTPWSWDLN